MTNSDRAHGRDVVFALSLPMSLWLCAEETRLYKPDPAFWHIAHSRLGMPMDRSWWHVSAYADYDLETARALGLTTVFVARPHARAPVAGREPDVTVSDLNELVRRAIA